MEKCVFCSLTSSLEDVVGETDNFILKVGYSIMSPGQLMVIPKQHYLCFAELPPSLEKEYFQIKEMVHQRISNYFSEPFQIEYGIWGQSVHHAHVHFIPSKSSEYKVESIIEEMVRPGGIKFHETDFKGLKDTYISEGSYVAIEEKGKLYVCHVNDIIFDPQKPNIYLDKNAFFTQVKGLKAVHSWKNLSEEEKIIDSKKRNLTIQKLKPFFT